MTTYELPEEPEGPLWDAAGEKWIRGADGGWRTPNVVPDCSMAWQWRVLLRFAPLTDTPPLKVGQEITGADAKYLPEWSIFAAPRDQPWQMYDGKLLCEGSDYGHLPEEFAGEYADDTFTVLRVGSGE